MRSEPTNRLLLPFLLSTLYLASQTMANCNNTAEAQFGAHLRSSPLSAINKTHDITDEPPSAGKIAGGVVIGTTAIILFCLLFYYLSRPSQSSLQDNLGPQQLLLEAAQQADPQRDRAADPQVPPGDEPAAVEEDRTHAAFIMGAESSAGA